MQVLHDESENRAGETIKARPKKAVERMFNVRELIDPGLVLVSYWRPDGDHPAPNADRVWAYGGVAPI